MKKQVEEMLGFKISDELFAKNLSEAKSKQKRIFEAENNKEVMSDDYLCQLTYEAVRTNTFNKYSVNYLELLNDMKKEHLAQSKGTHQHSYCNSSEEINQVDLQ